MSIQMRRLAALTVILVSLAACSGAAATTQPAGGGATQPAPVATPATGNSAPPVVAGGGGSDAAYCAALKVADAQALIKPTVAAAQTGGPEACAFVLPGEDINGDNFTVTVFPGDGDKQYYNDSVTGPASGPSNPLPGVGDVAIWEQPTPGAAPEVVAHQGSLTCVVQPPADASLLTIDPTGGITPAAATAYAVKEGVLCTDLFTVGS